MTATTAGTALCLCRHIHSMHNQDADCTLCRCSRFQISARTSSSHYRPGQATTRKRAARVDEGDRLLVEFQDDGQLDLARHKRGALVGIVCAPPAYTLDGWRITTNLGDLPPLSGSLAVYVLTEALPW